MSYIYQIKNKIDGKIYIGSSKNYKERWKQHTYSLNKNSHCNKYLQNAWNKYGENNFEFSILEKVKLSEQFIKEQEYLNVLKPFDQNGYNIIRQIESQLQCENPLIKRCDECNCEYESYSNLSKYCDECREKLKRVETERYFNTDSSAYSMGAFYAACSGAADAMGGWDNFFEDFYD